MYLSIVDLSKTEYNEYKSNENNEIVTFQKTNVFIGKNNSGKSRFMRQLLINEFNKDYIVNDYSNQIKQLKEALEEIIETANDYTKDMYKKTYLYYLREGQIISRSVEQELELGKLICGIIYKDSSYKGELLYRKLKEKKIEKSPYSFMGDSNIKIEQDILRRNVNILHDKYSILIDNIQSFVVPDTMFFPALTSLRKLNNLFEEDTYHDGLSKMFYSNYFSSIKNFNNIKTGQEIYNDMKKMLLGLKVDRELFLEYEDYISKNFFNGKHISIFIKEDDQNIYIKEEQEPEYPIFELGDGLQTLITITYYLFMNKNKPLKIFVDEPEIHLHPGLQRLLISKLQEFDKAQFFISTHSSSMIDICDEYDNNTAIICVEKKDEQKIVYNSAYDDMDLYTLIGIRPSSVILSNCTIWVEGPTDVYYIDELLRCYAQATNKKIPILGYNYNYAFNGSINIASKFDFDNDPENSTLKINKLSKKNFIIFDSDNMNRDCTNYKKMQEIKRILKEKCVVLSNIKTIENIIPIEMLKGFFIENYKPKQRKNKEYILSYLDTLLDCDKNEYLRKDLPDELAEYIFARDASKDEKGWREYCNNLWNSNKINIAIYFAEEVKKMNTEERKELLRKIPNTFTNMIKKIYNFIEQNN